MDAAGIKMLNVCVGGGGEGGVKGSFKKRR